MAKNNLVMSLVDMRRNDGCPLEDIDTSGFSSFASASSIVEMMVAR